MRKHGSLRQAIFVIGPSIAYIQLTQQQFACVDADAADHLARWNWSACWDKRGKRYYAHRAQWIGGVKRKIRMHRQVLEKNLDREPDHRNRNSLDNRIANLNPATRSEQMCNQGLRRDSSSGFRGISLFAKTGRWRASIQVQGERTFLGYFDSKEEAARAYDEAAKRLHGEFASLNMEEAA